MQAAIRCLLELTSTEILIIYGSEIMSHFTVLTAITLPEGVEDLLSQSSMQMSVCELVQATRSADIVNRIKTDTVKAETLRNQLQFENFI